MSEQKSAPVVDKKPASKQKTAPTSDACPPEEAQQ